MPVFVEKALDLLTVWDTLSDQEIENLPIKLLDAIEKLDVASKKLLSEEGLVDSKR